MKNFIFRCKATDVEDYKSLSKSQLVRRLSLIYFSENFYSLLVVFYYFI